MAILQDLLTESTRRLEKAGVATPRLDAEVLISRALGLSREELWGDPGRYIHSEEAGGCEKFILRREAREPLAYIVGDREFWSRTFEVTPDVLIPRPETEILIEHLLQGMASNKKQETLLGLDMCTGSGVLAITAALELPRARLIGTDISEKALAVAMNNSRLHGVDERIKWVESDFFGNLGAGKIDGGTLDFILCNPPYIATSEYRKLQPEITRFEPGRALDGGPEGLDFYPEIIEGAAVCLKAGGRLLMEIGCEQGQVVKDMFEKENTWQEVTLIQDYANRDRVLSARKKTDG